MSISNPEKLDVNVPLYLELFKTRPDCFAVQRTDGSYGPLNIEFQEKHIEQHVDGERTYGQYLVNPADNTVAFAAIDNDIDDDTDAPLSNALDAAVIQKKRAMNFGLKESQVWLEFSGRRGYHTWFFFDPPAKATIAKQFLEHLVDGMEIEGGHMEVFPKQVGIGDGEYGNLIKTPFGFHQKTGNRMLFVDEDGEPVPDQSSILRAAVRNRISPDVVGGILEEFGHDTEELVEEAEKRAEMRGQDLSEVVSETMDIRPCIEQAIRGNASAPHDENGQLRGDTGHSFRLAIAAELLNNGFSVEEADMYFSQFENYDQEITLRKLRKIKKSGHKPWRCETMKEKCGKYVADCPCPATRELDVVESMELNHKRYGHVWNDNDE